LAAWRRLEKAVKEVSEMVKLPEVSVGDKKALKSVTVGGILMAFLPPLLEALATFLKTVPTLGGDLGAWFEAMKPIVVILGQMGIGLGLRGILGRLLVALLAFLDAKTPKTT
jgi:hypothetical protein